MRSAVRLVCLSLLPLSSLLLVSGCSTTTQTAVEGAGDEGGASQAVGSPVEPAAAAEAPAVAEKPAAAEEPVNHLRRGLDLADKDDLRGAIAELERATEATPERLDVWRARVNLLDLAGRRQEAARAAWRLVELSPDAWQSWTTLASVLEAGAAWDAAIGAHKLAADRAKSDEELASTLFDLLVVANGALAIGADEAAGRGYAAASAIAGDTPFVQYHQARFLAVRGQRKEARKLARQIVKTLGDGTLSLPGGESVVKDLRRIARTGRAERPALSRTYHPLPQRFSTHSPASDKALDLAIDSMSERGYPLWDGRLLRLVVPATAVETAMPTERSMTVRFTPEQATAAEIMVTAVPAGEKADLEAELVAWRDRLHDESAPVIDVRAIAPGAFLAIARDKNVRPGTSDFVYALRFSGKLDNLVINISSQARKLDQASLERFARLGLAAQVTRLGGGNAKRR